MGYGKWTRWGRGSAHGYGLEFGNVLRFNVVLSGGVWHVSLNTRDIGAFENLDEAKAKVEYEARSEMKPALEHWAVFTADPKKRASRPG